MAEIPKNQSVEKPTEDEKSSATIWKGRIEWEITRIVKEYEKLVKEQEKLGNNSIKAADLTRIAGAIKGLIEKFDGYNKTTDVNLDLKKDQTKINEIFVAAEEEKEKRTNAMKKQEEGQKNTDAIEAKGLSENIAAGIYDKKIPLEKAA